MERRRQAAPYPPASSGASSAGQPYPPGACLWPPAPSASSAPVHASVRRLSDTAEALEALLDMDLPASPWHTWSIREIAKSVRCSTGEVADLVDEARRLDIANQHLELELL